MKKTHTFLFISVGIAIALYMILFDVYRKEPVIYASHGLLRELTMDEKIQEAQLIVIGKVTNQLPSKWRLQNQNDAKNVLPQEILREGGLFTDYLVRVDEILKGDGSRKKIRVRSFLGETNLVRWEDGSEPNYEVGQIYLFFLTQDSGPTAIVDKGDYISVNANTAIYKIYNGKAISADDEWDLEELLAYIQNKLAESDVTPIIEETTNSTETPLPVEIEEETPTPES